MTNDQNHNCKQQINSMATGTGIMLDMMTIPLLLTDQSLLSIDKTYNKNAMLIIKHSTMHAIFRLKDLQCKKFDCRKDRQHLTIGWISGSDRG